MTARTRKGWNTELDADKYKVQCLEAFCASLRSISAMNKSIRAHRVKYKREKLPIPWLAASLSFSLSLFPLYIYISLFFFLSRPHRGGCSCGCNAQRKEAACKMGRGMRDNRPIIVDRDDTWALSQNYSRTVTRGRIQFGVASTLTGKKERWNENSTKDGCWKGCGGGWEIQPRPGFSLGFSDSQIRILQLRIRAAGGW